MYIYLLSFTFFAIFLQLWISRIAAATREHNMKYPTLIHNLGKVSTRRISFKQCVDSAWFTKDFCGDCKELSVNNSMSLFIYGEEDSFVYLYLKSPGFNHCLPFVSIHRQVLNSTVVCLAN